MTALFGPAGNSESFAANGHKKTIEVPAFVNEFGLTAYEYQCGHGSSGQQSIRCRIW